MLSITQLKKKVSKTFELSINNFFIKEGEIVAIIGNNGSGKTLLLNSILNNILIDSDSIKICNKSNRTNDWKEFTGIYMNKRYLLDFMTPLEYFGFIGSFYNVSKRELPKILVRYKDFLGEDSNLLLNKLIIKLSEGSKDKIGIIAAIFYNPKLLILDEPFSHLDTPSTLNLLKELKLMNLQYNTTQIISCPNLDKLVTFCTRIILVEKGQIKYDLHNNPESISIIDEYFCLKS